MTTEWSNSCQSLLDIVDVFRFDEPLYEQSSSDICFGALGGAVVACKRELYKLTSSRTIVLMSFTLLKKQLMTANVVLSPFGA